MLNMSSYIKIIFGLLFVFLISDNSIADTSKKDKHSNLTKGIFVVASNKMEYGALSHSVIYITQHDAAGTSGFIVNRPTNLRINQAFPDTQASKSTNKILYFGGPLHAQYLFMLTKTDFSRGLHTIQKDIYFGAGEEVTQRLRADNKRDKIRTYAGFMSWGPKQLGDEIDQGDWILTPAASEELFSEETETLWKTLSTRWTGSWI